MTSPSIFSSFVQSNDSQQLLRDNLTLWTSDMDVAKEDPSSTSVAEKEAPPAPKEEASTIAPSGEGVKEETA
jgi:hypothetical protein